MRHLGASLATVALATALTVADKGTSNDRQAEAANPPESAAAEAKPSPPAASEARPVRVILPSPYSSKR